MGTQRRSWHARFLPQSLGWDLDFGNAEDFGNAPVVQPASTPDWDGNLAAQVVQPASSMIESSSDADAEMSPTKVLTLLLGAGALGGTTSTANAFQAPTSMHGGVVARGILGPGIARTGPATMHDGPNIHYV